MIYEILAAVLGSTTLLTALMYRNASRRVKNAEAAEAESRAEMSSLEADSRRREIENSDRDYLHSIIDNLNRQLEDSTKANGEKTALIRKLNGDLTSCLNTEMKLRLQLAAKERFIGWLMQWHCRREYRDCTRREPAQEVPLAYLPPPEMKEAMCQKNVSDGCI